MEHHTFPIDMDDRYLITLDEFCTLTHLPKRSVLRWHERGVGPRWAPFNGNGRLYISAAEARRFLRSAENATQQEQEGES